MSDRNENLAKNTVLFAIGSIGSKLLQIILVPFYTRVMTDAEFGTADILQAAVSLLLPVFSLTVYESVFRYAMEKDYDRKAVFSAGAAVTFAGVLFLCICGIGVSVFSDIEYVWLVAANTAAVAFRTLLSQYARAIDRTALFTADNILLTACVLVFNIFFISTLDMGINGYMCGYIAANAVSCAFLAVMLRKEISLNTKKITKELLKTLLIFSIPLIPNTICWWVSSFTDRIMITSMISVAENGLYAAAHKLPSLLSVVVTVFFQAWQISANEEFQKKDAAEFYSEIFEQISSCVFVLASLLMLFCRPITDIFLGEDYYSSWRYMPVLLLAMTFFAFAQFLGSIYSANKKTSMAFVTNFIAMVVNVVFNFVFIRAVGTVGAAAATALSYLVLWIVRIFNTRGIIAVKYKLPQTVASSVLLTLQTVVITACDDQTVVWAVCGACAAAIIAANAKTLAGLVKFALGMACKILKKS